MVIQIDNNVITNEVGTIQDCINAEKSAKVIALYSNKVQKEELALVA